jgi:hypothetical protein
VHIRSDSRARLVVAAAVLAAGFGSLPAGATNLRSPTPVASKAAVPTPTVTRIPADAGIRHRPFNYYPYGIGLQGYSEEEFLLEGSTSQGLPFSTRMIVRRPTDPRKFNGTLLAEWHNVTAGRDLDVDWQWAHDFAMSNGYAYVGVSAQTVGVTFLKAWDPVRYANLVHPGDDPGSFDIFSQAIQALRSPGSTNPMRGLPAPTQVLAMGQSQSAGRLASYINNDDYVNNGMVDGFIVHSSGGEMRDDAGVARPPVPVFKLMADGEGIAARQADSPTFRLWEEASTGHTDGDNQDYTEANRSIEFVNLAGDACTAAGIPINRLHRKMILNAAIKHLTLWVAKGKQPPTMPRWELDGNGMPVKDEYGNTASGVRLPDLIAPVATHGGDGCAGGLAGSTVPLPDEQLDRMYPTHAGYVAKFRAATSDAVKAGFLLPEDGARLVAEADARHVGADLD